LVHPGLFRALSELLGGSPSILGSGCLARVLARRAGELVLVCARLLRSVAIYFEDDVSGVGDASFGAQRINYFLSHVLSYGPEVKEASVRDSDYLLRIGWITFGVDVNIPGIGSVTYWRAPIWLNFYNTEWSPIAQTDISAQDFAVWATRVRWSLSTGTEIHLLVVGF